MAGATPYRVGDLEVKINAISANAVSSLDAVIAKMSSLSSILKTITVSDMKWITSLGTRMKSLSKRMAEIDWTVVEAGFNRLTVAITPFLDKVISAEASLNALNNTLNKINGNKLKSLSNFSVGGGARKATFGFLSFGKMLTTFYIARRLANVMADIVQYGVDYTETLNLWQVAMRDNLSMATQFVNKMSKAYGISQKTLMQAQATFRNMIGSLGDLSDSTSYALSEAITQMAIDYSSLYNAPIEEAINKFQSALAGQVRPIRSISGYDITEKTIQALYEALGGTKTQRQLSRTEKQLLAIYAIFNQMEKSGALGDMTKTLGNFANQSRMMVENWKELATWVGTSITYLLQQSGIMVKINALLITASNVAKAIAFSLGYETPNFAAGWENSVNNTIEAVDELKGKLLGFDKIRALQTQEEGISIDEKLLNAISGYSSLIEQANNEAAKLAKTWTAWFIDEDTGKFTEQAKELGNAIKNIGIFLGILLGYNITAKTVKLVAAILGLTKASTSLYKILVASVIFAIIKAVDAFEKGEYWAGAFYIALAGASGLIFAFKLLNKASAETLITMARFFNSTGAGIAALLAVSMGIATFILNLHKLSDTAKILIPVLSALAGVIAAVAIAKAGMTFRAAITAGSIVAGIGMVVGSLASVKEYKNGGMPDKGTMFIAGEAGAEIVATSPNGQTGVSNVQQIEQAFYNALVRYAGSSSDGGDIVVKVGEEEVFRATRKGANRRGLDFAKKA